MTKTYTYGDTEWKDKLTAYNGQTITYDEIGNPLTYRDGYTFTWANGRQLSTVTNGTNSYSYTYNADGLRTSKTVNGTKTEYYWMGSVLQGQKTGSEYILYLHDENGNTYGFLLKNGTTQEYYYYIFNAQGDVIGILNSAGTKVVEYTYSAWGEVLSVTGTLASTIGQSNPIRYRGYYYDNETGFYYCNSRYYDPETCRWVNADSVIAGVGDSVHGYNMYIYCFNNPIGMEDASGNWPRWITAAVAVVATAVAVVATIAAVPVVAPVATITAVVWTTAYCAQSVHYDNRKAKNTNLPQTRQEAIDSGWHGPDTTPKGPAADCHQYTSEDKSNVKYVSPDGHREVIYNSNGEIVEDSRDIGTYNFSPSGTLWGDIGHFLADILPWVVFGNDDDDPGIMFNMIFG